MAGAHPGYPDLLGFGRRSLECTEEELIDYVLYQVGALKGFLDYFQMTLQHVKLHGALYTSLVHEERPFLQMARAVNKAFGDLIFLTLSTPKTTELKRVAKKEGIRIALEAFPDRMYTDDGALVSRKQEGAVLKDRQEIAQRAVTMVKERGIEGQKGRWVPMEIDTLCLHGDNLESVAAAEEIHEWARREEIALRPLASFL
jgi:UPF0271 protein